MKKKFHIIPIISIIISILSLFNCYFIVGIMPHLFQINTQVGTLSFNTQEFPDELTDVKLKQLVNTEKYFELNDENTSISVTKNNNHISNNKAEYDVKITHTFKTIFGEKTIERYGKYSYIKASNNTYSTYSIDDKTNDNGNTIIKKEPVI